MQVQLFGLTASALPSTLKSANLRRVCRGRSYQGRKRRMKIKVLVLLAFDSWWKPKGFRGLWRKVP